MPSLKFNLSIGSVTISNAEQNAFRILTPEWSTGCPQYINWFLDIFLSQHTYAY